MVRNIEPAGTPVTIPLPQQITQKTLPLLERQVDDAVSQRPPIVEMPCSNVQVIDSAGLNWLLATKARLETVCSNLKLVDPSPIVMDIFIATRLDSRFNIAYTAAGGNRNA